MHSYRVVWLVILSVVIGSAILLSAEPARAQQPQPRVVENVDVQNNRRLRKDDILYWIQTRPGDQYSPTQVERDLQAINALGFFEKTKTRVTVEDAPRGGLRVTF